MTLMRLQLGKLSPEQCAEFVQQEFIWKFITNVTDLTEELDTYARKRKDRIMSSFCGYKHQGEKQKCPVYKKICEVFQNQSFLCKSQNKRRNSWTKWRKNKYGRLFSKKKNVRTIKNSNQYFIGHVTRYEMWRNADNQKFLEIRKTKIKAFSIWISSTETW